MKTIHEEGMCPACKSEDIEYLGPGVDGADYCYFYELRCNKCESISKEYYVISYHSTVLQQEGEMK